jgi:hypothetical protein
LGDGRPRGGFNRIGQTIDRDLAQRRIHPGLEVEIEQLAGGLLAIRVHGRSHCRSNWHTACSTGSAAARSRTEWRPRAAERKTHD